jgi:hypothetical protein
MQSAGSEKVVDSINEKLLKLATQVEIEIEKIRKANAAQLAKTAGLDKFFAEEVLLTGTIQSSVIYDVYSHYVAEHDLFLASTKEFPLYMNSRKVKKTTSHNAVFYAASILPDMPPSIFNAAIVFRSLHLEHSEQTMFKFETKPWLIGAVSSFTSQCNQSSPDTIASADSFREFLTVQDISERIDFRGLSEKNNHECQNPISLHLALGLGSLWLTSSPATWDEFIASPFFTLLRQKYEPGPTPGEPTSNESTPHET